MKYVEYCFGPNQTINAILFLKNQHSFSETEKEMLLNEFNKINGYKIIRPGENVKIPILERYEELFGL